MISRYILRAKIWRYRGTSAWHFVTLPKRVSMQIRVASSGRRSAWGSVRVTARVDDAEWKTSLFPDSKTGRYVMPVKAAVRKQCSLEAGDTVRITIWMSAGRQHGRV